MITGATSGIGFEIAKIYASRGQNMVLVSRDEEKLCHMARTLNEVSDVIIMPLDLSVSGSARVLFDECERLKINIHVLVNNAGFGKFGDITKMDPVEVESMLTLNVTTLTTISKLFGARMKDRGKGYILNVSSTAAFQPVPYLSAYSASKTYVQFFSNALREELKPFGVQVSCLYPGPTDTNFFDVAFKNENPERLKRQYMMPPGEVAAMAIEGMEKGRKSIIPGAMNKMVSNTARLLPPSTLARILRKFSHN